MKTVLNELLEWLKISTFPIEFDDLESKIQELIPKEDLQIQKAFIAGTNSFYIIDDEIVILEDHNNYYSKIYSNGEST